MKKASVLLAALAATTFAAPAAGLRITEVMYTGLYGEFTELTNTNSAASISLTNLAYTDNHNDIFNPFRSVALPALSLAPGHSIVLTEADPSIFVAVWFTLPGHAVPSTLDAVVGNLTVNLGRADSVIVGDRNFGIQIDQLDFNDQAPVGNPQKGPRSEDISAVPNVTPGTPIPFNNFSTWILSDGLNASGIVVTLPIGSAVPWRSGNPAGNGSLGSPGIYIP